MSYIQEDIKIKNKNLYIKRCKLLLASFFVLYMIKLLPYGKMILYNGQWYYGNQSNKPTLVSTSKEINLIQKYQSSDAYTGTLTNASKHPITFTGWNDYYTYDYFEIYCASVVSQVSSNGDKYLDIDMGNGSTFTISNQQTKYNQKICLIPTFSTGNIGYIAFGAGSMQNFNDNSTNFVNYLTIVPYSSKTQWNYFNNYSFTNLSFNAFSIRLYAAKFEY